MKTRLFRIIQDAPFKLNQPYFAFQKRFVQSLLFLFLGFMTGSTFGTFLGYIRPIVVWDGAIIFALLIAAEKIGKWVYQKTQTNNKTQITKFVNCLKIGLFLGFFIDAFKVGS
jgi:hypothetical protein